MHSAYTACTKPVLESGQLWKMSKISEFEDNLINNIRDYENLYDSGHTQFHDAHVKANSWADVAKKLASTAKICENTWDGMRKRFSRSRKAYKLRYPTGSGRGYPTGSYIA